MSPVHIPKSAGEGTKREPPPTHLQLVEPLDAGGESEIVHLHGKGGLPVLGRWGQGGLAATAPPIPIQAGTGREALRALQGEGGGGGGKHSHSHLNLEGEGQALRLCTPLIMRDSLAACTPFWGGPHAGRR